MVRFNVVSKARSGNINDLSISQVYFEDCAAVLFEQERRGKDKIHCDNKFVNFARARNKLKRGYQLRGLCCMLYCEGVKVLQCGLGASREYCVMYSMLYRIEAKKKPGSRVSVR